MLINYLILSLDMSKTIKDYVLNGGIQGRWFLAEGKESQIYQVLGLGGEHLVNSALIANVYDLNENLVDKNRILFLKDRIDAGDHEYTPQRKNPLEEGTEIV